MLVKFATTVAASRQAVWAFVAEFANIGSWDPGVKAAKKTSAGETGVGTTYDLTTVFKGSESQMTYTVEQWDPPNKVVVRGDSSSVAAEDSIVFSDAATPGHTTIEYTADIRLKGFLSLFTWLVASDIRALGDAAKDGMNRAFAEGRHQR